MSIARQLNPININDVTIQPISDGESYKYLGQDENLGYVGKLNKERVKKEYTSRVKKISESKLSGCNKHIAQ